MWKRFVIEVDGQQYFVVAKVYIEPSHMGINGGRVSKMQVCKGTQWDPYSIVYDYDRGLSLNKAPANVLTAALAKAVA